MINCDHGRKRNGAVAVLTNVGRLRVCRILADRIRTIVAADTVAVDIDVVKIRRQPCNCAMAVVAVVTARNMRRVFASCGNAVMAGAATSKHLGVIDHHHGRKHTCIVTIFTYVGCLRVGRVLADGVRAVMAVAAIARDGCVVEECGQPAGRGMAVVAGIAAGDMCRRLAGGNDAVVAGVATAEHLGVINSHHRRKYISCVAVLTDIRSLNVCRVLAGCVGTVMAAGAVSGDIHMIEICWQPTNRTVAVVASVTAFNMGWVLTCGRYTVMAGATSTNYLGVIDNHHRRKHIRRVTVLADI